MFCFGHQIFYDKNVGIYGKKCSIRTKICGCIKNNVHNEMLIIRKYMKNEIVNIIIDSKKKILQKNRKNISFKTTQRILSCFKKFTFINSLEVSLFPRT